MEVNSLFFVIFMNKNKMKPIKAKKKNHKPNEEKSVYLVLV